MFTGTRNLPGSEGFLVKSLFWIQIAKKAVFRSEFMRDSFFKLSRSGTWVFQMEKEMLNVPGLELGFPRKKSDQTFQAPRTKFLVQILLSENQGQIWRG